MNSFFTPNLRRIFKATWTNAPSVMLQDGMRNINDPQERIAFEAAILLPEETRIVATGLAELPDPVLQKLEVGDGMYGFHVAFAPPLTPRERDHLVVRSARSHVALEMAPQFQGYVDERSVHHVRWLDSKPV